MLFKDHLEIVTDAGAVLQLLDLDRGDDAPTVAVEVLALAVVVGEEVGTVEVGLGLQSVHVTSELELYGRYAAAVLPCPGWVEVLAG